MAKFRNRPMIVDAIRITQEMVTQTEKGVFKGQPGDWLISSSTGEEFFVEHDSFMAHYDPVNEESVEYLAKSIKLFKIGF